ncbi:MAG TPA: Lrp/AsnC family transcriptional regulator [Gammaproteobacteria bacterium]|nr:Lrp/AsnC family transcriptional regulator [Gammaproteobacteria bacterium]
MQLTIEDRALIKAVQDGLPVVSRPYAEIAKQLSISETEVISRLRYLINNGAIKRYGVVVRHKELGYTANGMVVWDVPDDRVEELGMCIGKYDCVTLSYRRPRRLPDWSYNLFTMVHGSNREEVKQKVEEIVARCGLQDIEHTILFSTRRFKQRGASYTQKDPATRSEKVKTNKLHLVK